MPRSFLFRDWMPGLQEQLEHGIQLWHETAEQKISNAETFFAKISLQMDFKAHRERVAFVKSLYAEGNISQTSDQLIIETYDSDEEILGSARSVRVVTAAEMREDFLNREFALPCAQTTEMLVVTGSRTPVDWPEGRPYPFNGLYISAHYFAEAKSLLKEKNERAAWVSLTRAFYYLGLNSSSMTTTEAAEIASRTKHKVTKLLTALIVQMSESIEQNGKPLGFKLAAKKISELIVADHKNVLQHFRATHLGKKRSSNISDRVLTADLTTRILKWAESSRKHPHPEVRQAMLRFKTARGRGEVPIDDGKDRRYL